MTLVVSSRFVLGPLLGRGAFGTVYKARDIKTGETVAIKLEKRGARHPQLKYEARVYQELQRRRVAVHVPRVFYVGVDGEFTVMVMQLLGYNLQQLFEESGRKLTRKTTLMVGMHMLDLIRGLHQGGFVHRDIKPENFAFGTGGRESLQLFLFDFGLSKKYKGRRGAHIPFSTSKRLVGTPRFSSAHAHVGMEQGRRDDIISLGYALLYVNKGTLPWMGIRSKDKKRKNKLVLKAKRRHIKEPMKAGECEAAFEMVRYGYSLHFQEEPDYDYLLSTFRLAMRKHGYVNDNAYCWIERP